MIITVNSDKSIIECRSKKIACSCVVRNEINGWRKPDEVVYAIPAKVPYMPRPFPVGIWNIKRPLVKNSKDKYLFPYYIPTDAWQYVDEWEVKDGLYGKPTGRKIIDTAYGLHYSESGTTLGCIKITDIDDLLYLVESIMDEVINNSEIKLIVEA